MLPESCFRSAMSVGFSYTQRVSNLTNFGKSLFK